MSTDFKKSFWSDAAGAGMILGLAYVAFSVLSWLLRLELNQSWANSLINFAIIAVCVYYFGTKRAAKHGAAGYGYGQSMGYTLVAMLFAGVISGVGLFIMHNYVAPDYYQEIIDTALIKSGIDIDSDDFQQGLSMAQKMMKNPVFMVFSGIFNMLVYGGLIGLIASIFLKKPVDPFAEENDGK